MNNPNPKPPLEPHTLEKLLSQSKRNGYLQQVKQFTRQTAGMPNTYDIGYRKRVNAYYKKKILKPFCLIQQPEYRRELRFNSDFNAFVRSIPEFEGIREDAVDGHVEEQLKQVHSDTLVYDFGRTCEVSPENISKRKMRATLDDDNVFTTKISLTEHVLGTRSRNANQSRIDIVLDSSGRQRSIGHNETSPQLSPKRRIKQLRATNQKQNSTLQLKLHKSRRSNHSLQKSKQSENALSPHSPIPNPKSKIKINQGIALQNLNKLTGTEHKLKNFRIGRQILHEILCKRYGNQVVTGFFALQTIEDFQGIVKMVTEILAASPKLVHMLAFLSMDYNQDGLITEDELTQLSNYLSSSSPITEDINRILTYTQENPQLKCLPDLPMDFIKQPTLREYLKINQEGKDVEVGSVRGVFRLFSLKVEDQPGEKGNSLPSIGRGKVDVSRKMVRINFQHFQKIFDKVGQPNYIEDLVTFLIGKNYNKMQDTSPRKTSFTNAKKLRRGTFSLDPRQKSLTYHQEKANHLEKAHQILGQMIRDNKNFTTVQYD